MAGASRLRRRVALGWVVLANGRAVRWCRRPRRLGGCRGVPDAYGEKSLWD